MKRAYRICTMSGAASQLACTRTRIGGLGVAEDVHWTINQLRATVQESKPGIIRAAWGRSQASLMSI